MSYNPILNTDSYKTSHFKQYDPRVEFVNFYIESRGGRWNRTLFYGLQGFLKKYLSVPVMMEHIEEAEQILKMHGVPFNRSGWEKIVKKYDGYFPVEIESAPEGLIIPTGNVLVQVRNTDPELPWIVSYLETALLRSIWYPTAVATNSWMCKQQIRRFLEKTGTPESLDYKLHDFGARGVSSFESAGIGASAHLINFRGTDSISGMLWAMKYYNAKNPAVSIPASEHSTMTSWTKNDEFEAYNNMVHMFGDSTFACVIDSYDAFSAIKDHWSCLTDRVRDLGGTVVLRPDSGDPVVMSKKLLTLMLSTFGYTVNSKGYKVLPDHIRMIYGDGIDEQSISDILSELEISGISADNIAFGMGGALLQHLDRDTLRFAMKLSAILRSTSTSWIPVHKEPKDAPEKASKGGILKLVKDEHGEFTTKSCEYPNHREGNLLEPVFLNGEILRDMSFNEVIENSLLQ